MVKCRILYYIDIILNSLPVALGLNEVAEKKYEKKLLMKTFIYYHEKRGVYKGSVQFSLYIIEKKNTSKIITNNLDSRTPMFFFRRQQKVDSLVSSSR